MLPWSLTLAHSSSTDVLTGGVSQMLPFTPISEQLLSADWIRTEYPIVAKALLSSKLEAGWKVKVPMDKLP